MRYASLAGLLLLSGIAPALADGPRVPPVDHQATIKECAACHMAFPPQMLPARSWEALMGDLANHFGENAQLDAAAAADIKAMEEHVL